jgi:coenzyme Q-binding protein COQ10
MPKIIKNFPNDYPKAEVFKLISDIEAYPEFIPWVVGARIIERNKEFLLAELLIKYKFFRASYTSKVQLIENEKIIVELEKGPFKYLLNQWVFEDGNLEFILDFEFSSPLFADIISEKLEQYSDKIFDCFMQRAKTKII